MTLPLAAGDSSGVLELGFLWLAEVLMLAGYICFWMAFAVRKTDRARHMFLGKLGAAIVVAGLIAVEVVTRVLGWEFPVRSHEWLRWHIGVACVALLLLVTVVVTGITRQRSIHVRLYPVFLPTFGLTILLSLFAFRLW